MKNKSKLLVADGSAVPGGWPPANLLKQPDMFKRKVIWDLHGPILDWATAFAEVASGLYNVKIDAKAVRFYCMGYDADIPLTPAQFDAVFPHFARLARGGYGSLRVTPGIQETFKALAAAGISSEIWTWVPGAAEHHHETKKAYGTGIAQSTTYKLIESLGLVKNVRTGVRFIRPDAKAAEMAREHAPLIVEDNPVTAVAAGMNFGHACLLTPETYNQGLVAPGVLRLDSHDQLAATIIAFFNALDEAGALLGGKS